MTERPLLNYRYKILKALAEGGFGKTFLAEDTQMPSKRRCVIKQLKPVSNRPEIAQIVQERFTREAAVLDSVGKDHEQIPTLYAYFATSGQFYLVQEWIDGEPLQVAEYKVISEEKAQLLLQKILPAIAHVHSNNVIHRDIKPDNIIIRKSDQMPCLIDFGAVKELMSTVVSPAGLPKSSIVVGTAGYMPPEQAAGHPTFSSDLYSLGMTAICLLTGKYPAAIPTDSRTRQLLWQQYIPNINPGLAQVLTKAVHPLPQHRYHSAEEMLAALPGSAAIPAGTSPMTFPGTAQPIPAQTIAPPTALASSATLPSPTLLAASAASSEAFIQQPTPFPATDSTLQPGYQAETPTQTFPIKRVAIVTAAFALGAGALFAARPRVAFEINSAADGSRLSSTQSTASDPNTTNTSSIAEDPTSATEFTDRAIAFYDQGRLTQALEDVESALALEPNTLEALSLKGDILANQSLIDLPGAIAAYSQALTLEPDNTDLLQKRCTAYQQNDDLDLAHQDCTQLISLLPDSALLYDQRGDIRNAQENYPGAIEDYTKAIEINESQGNPSANQSIYYSRGNAYAAIGEPGKGLDDFEKMRTAQ